MPLDGSEEGERALPPAIAYATHYKRLLLVVRVLVPPPLIGAAGAYMLNTEAQEREEQEARAYLSALRKRLAREQGVFAHTILAGGNAADEIVHVAEAHDGSLIVMSTHGRGGIARVLSASVIARLMQESPVPLFIVPPRIETPVTVEAPDVVDANVIPPAPSTSVASAT